MAPFHYVAPVTALSSCHLGYSYDFAWWTRVVCTSRDVSEQGISLETAAPIDIGTRVTLSLYDPDVGTVVMVAGVIARVMQNPPALGVLIDHVSDEWQMMVESLRSKQRAPAKAQKRMRVLVVGDEQRQRGAMALYVKSGWDVMFANDTSSVQDALAGMKLDAVVGELDDDPVGDGPSSWTVIASLMEYCKQVQPAARRVVRGNVRGMKFDNALVHGAVDRSTGLEALLDAVTSNYANRT